MVDRSLISWTGVPGHVVNLCTDMYVKEKKREEILIQVLKEALLICSKC